MLLVCTSQVAVRRTCGGSKLASIWHWMPGSVGSMVEGLSPWPLSSHPSIAPSPSHLYARWEELRRYEQIAVPWRLPYPATAKLAECKPHRSSEERLPRIQFHPILDQLQRPRHPRSRQRASGARSSHHVTSSSTDRPTHRPSVQASVRRRPRGRWRGKERREEQVETFILAQRLFAGLRHGTWGWQPRVVWHARRTW